MTIALIGLNGCARPPASGDDDGDDDDVVDARPGSNGDCTEWRVGTVTGYDNSNFDDDPNAGSIMEFTGLTDEFYNNVPMAAIDLGDWDRDSYHWIDVDYQGTLARVGAWDACRDEDCPDGTACCTNNKQRFDVPGYLIDLETRTAQRLFGVFDAESTLNDRVDYRVCEAFDPDEVANRYGVFR